MQFINKKSIAIGIITLVLGVLAACAVTATTRGWFDSSTSVEGTIAAFILNPEGKTDGAILDTGDQVHFGAETGALISGQIKVGDRLKVTGHAGTKSDYGREIRAESLQIGDQTITVLHSQPEPRGDKGGKPRPADDRKGPKPPRPGDDRQPRTGDDKMPPPVLDDANAPKPEMNQPPTAPIPAPTASASGQIRFVLVGGRGEARGLILSTGEQIALPKEVNDANLTFVQDTQVSAEGEAAKTDAGTFIHPTRLSIGNQTFSFNR